MNKIVTLLMAALLVSGCGGGKSVREEPTKLHDFQAESRVKLLWSADSGASAIDLAVKLSPAIAGGAIYTSDPKGNVIAFATDNGRKLWESGLDLSITGAVAVGSGIVVVASKKGDVVALDRANGKKIWTSNLPSQVLSPAAIYAGVVVVQSVDGKLTGLSAADGKKLWVYARAEPPLSLHGTAAPVATDNVVLSGFASGKLAAVQIQDGKLLWDMTVTQPRGRNEIERLVDVDVSPLLVRNVIYAASYQGKVIAMDVQTGRILWSRDMSTYSGMDADSSNLYLTDDQGNVVALDLRTGASVWKQEQLRARQLNAPRYINGQIAVGDLEGYVHWLSADDGHFVARYRVANSAIRSQPLISDDTLYVSSQSGKLAALQLEKK